MLFVIYSCPEELTHGLSWLFAAGPAVYFWRLQLCWISLSGFSPLHTSTFNAWCKVLSTSVPSRYVWRLRRSDAADTTAFYFFCTFTALNWTILAWLNTLITMILRLSWLALLGLVEPDRCGRSERQKSWNGIVITKPLVVFVRLSRIQLALLFCHSALAYKHMRTHTHKHRGAGRELVQKLSAYFYFCVSMWCPVSVRPLLLCSEKYILDFRSEYISCNLSNLIYRFFFSAIDFVTLFGIGKCSSSCCILLKTPSSCCMSGFGWGLGQRVNQQGTIHSTAGCEVVMNWFVKGSQIIDFSKDSCHKLNKRACAWILTVVFQEFSFE